MSCWTDPEAGCASDGRTIFSTASRTKQHTQLSPAVPPRAAAWPWLHAQSAKGCSAARPCSVAERKHVLPLFATPRGHRLRAGRRAVCSGDAKAELEAAPKAAAETAATAATAVSAATEATAASAGSAADEDDCDAAPAPAAGAAEEKGGDGEAATTAARPTVVLAVAAEEAATEGE